jgi:hypothetical protein
MKNKIFALFTASLMIFNLAGSAIADVKNGKAKKAQVNPLVAILPASDIVVSLDSKRFFSDGLPRILASNQPVLAEITSNLDDIRSNLGIDLRQFDRVAIGLVTKRISPTEIDFDPVVIARGNFPAGALVSVAKLASNGTYREEKIGAKTVYVFSAKEFAQKNAPKISNSKLAAMIQRTLNGLTKEVAVTSIDGNTIAFGSLPRVRQTVEAKTRVGVDLTNLLARRPAGILTFAAKTPEGMSKFLPLDNDELGKNLDSIRYLSGSMDITEGAAVVNLTAKTVRTDQAASLLQTLSGLQLVGKAFLGGAKGADKQVYARMIDNVKFTQAGSEVTLDLSVPQSDIDILVGQIK